MLTQEDISVGIHEGLSFEDYLRIPAMNRTTLEHAAMSMAHLRYAMENPDEETSEERIGGTALHCAVLEPERFAERFITGPINPRTNEPYGLDTKAVAEFQAANPGKIVVAGPWRDKVRCMADSIRKHPAVRDFLMMGGPREVACVADLAGVRCKGRIDYYAEGFALLDFKTTRCAKSEAFRRAVSNYGYHRQAAFYTDIFAAVRGVVSPFVIAAVENVAPYAAAVFAIGPKSMEIGRKEYREWLTVYAACRRTGNWPAYPDVIEDIEVPKWELDRFDMGE